LIQTITSCGTRSVVAGFNLRGASRIATGAPETTTQNGIHA